MYPCDTYWHGSTSSFSLSTRSTVVDCLLYLLCPGTCHLTLTKQSLLSMCKKKQTKLSLLYAFFWVIPRCLNFICLYINVKCFKYLGSMLTEDGRCMCEIKSRIAMAKAAFNKKKKLFTSKLDLNLRKTSEVIRLEHSSVWC